MAHQHRQSVRTSEPHNVQAPSTTARRTHARIALWARQNARELCADAHEQRATRQRAAEYARARAVVVLLCAIAVGLIVRCGLHQII